MPNSLIFQIIVAYITQSSIRTGRPAASQREACIKNLLSRDAISGSANITHRHHVKQKIKIPPLVPATGPIRALKQEKK